MSAGARSGSYRTAVCRAGTRGGHAGTAEERALVRAAQLAEELASAWRRGERPRAEDCLEREGELAGHPVAAALVIGEEVRLRREFGPPVSPSELGRRFPQWGGELPELLGPAPGLPRPEGPRFPACGEVFAECRLAADEHAPGLGGSPSLGARPPDCTA